MKIAADNPSEYIENAPEIRREALKGLRNVILENIPEGFQETMSYGMIGYVVPHSLYPQGYHADPEKPLPFINLASQKNHIALYHMGLYSDRKMMDWFTREYQKKYNKKPDMGKSCLRFRNPDNIPLELIGQLVSMMTPNDWIDLYETNIKR